MVLMSSLPGWVSSAVRSFASNSGVSPGALLLSVAFDQRHFRPIDRNHHARGVGVDFYWDAPHFIGLGEGVDDVELPQLFLRHLDQLEVGVVVGPSVPQEGLANALVNCMDR